MHTHKKVVWGKYAAALDDVADWGILVMIETRMR